MAQVLHDAFFKYQTRPKLTHMGELYYEGKVRTAAPACAPEREGLQPTGEHSP